MSGITESTHADADGPQKHPHSHTQKQSNTIWSV